MCGRGTAPASQRLQATPDKPRGVPRSAASLPPSPPQDTGPPPPPQPRQKREHRPPRPRSQQARVLPAPAPGLPPQQGRASPLSKAGPRPHRPQASLSAPFPSLVGLPRLLRGCPPPPPQPSRTGHRGSPCRGRLRRALTARPGPGRGLGDSTSGGSGGGGSHRKPTGPANHGPP